MADHDKRSVGTAQPLAVGDLYAGALGRRGITGAASGWAILVPDGCDGSGLRTAPVPRCRPFVGRTVGT